LKVEKESQFNTAGGSEFQVRGAAVLNYRLANDVRRNGTHSSGTDDDRVLRALVDGNFLEISCMLLALKTNIKRGQTAPTVSEKNCCK